MISKQISNKIKICSVIATIFVVYRHSFVINAFFPTYENVDSILLFFNKTIASITEIAVPYFFIISGFFFFSSKTKYLEAIRKKIRTLLIPFIIWNFIGYVVLLATNKNELANNIILFLKGFLLSEYYGPLWYVRDLLLFFLLSPLYSWILNNKYISGFVIISLSILWTPVDCNIFSSEGFFFFIIGGFLSKNKNYIHYNLT